MLTVHCFWAWFDQCLNTYFNERFFVAVTTVAHRGLSVNRSGGWALVLKELCRLPELDGLLFKKRF
jgi:hypothetical protein